MQKIQNKTRELFLGFTPSSDKKTRTAKDIHIHIFEIQTAIYPKEYEINIMELYTHTHKKKKRNTYIHTSIYFKNLMKIY